ncbi:MAG: TolC family protein [Planctomycetia bacterium]|nr:TolC family protein [Planctomycetia bacterium]
MIKLFSRSACWFAYAVSLVAVEPTAAQTALPLPKETPTPKTTLTPLPSVPQRVNTKDGNDVQTYDLDILTQMMLQSDPRLAQAALAVQVAAGRAVQAGLYPNPVAGFSADELFDRTGPGGILTPSITQEIVTGNKLGLAQSAAERERQKAELEVQSVRFRRTGAVRSAYYDLLALQRRLEMLGELTRLADESLQSGERLLKAGQNSRLDVVQLEVEKERYVAEREAVNRELPAAFRRLAAAVGVPDLPMRPLAGRLDTELPSYILDTARTFIAANHPEVLAAKKGVERAQYLLDRARVEPKPNITLMAGYTYQGQNRSNDMSVGVSLPVPIWNRNQGNIAVAQAELGDAIQHVGRAQTELTDQLGEAFAAYASAKRRAELYRERLLPRAREGFELSLKGYKANQFDYLRVLEAQRALAQADLETIRSLGDAWKAAANLSALLLEENWPLKPSTNTPGPRIEIIRPAP